MTRIFLAGMLVGSLCAAVGVIIDAQRLPEAFARSLVLLPDREAWVVIDDLPGTWRICGEIDRSTAELRGCVTIKSLRALAEKERRAKKSEPDTSPPRPAK